MMFNKSFYLRLHSKQVDMTKRSDTFSLGEREKVLEQVRF